MLQRNLTVLNDLAVMSNLLVRLTENIANDQPNLAAQSLQELVRCSTDMTRALWAHQQKASMDLPVTTIIGTPVSDKTGTDITAVSIGTEIPPHP